MKGTTAFYFGRKVVRNKPVHNFSAKKILPSRKFTKGWDSVNSKLTGDEANRCQMLQSASDIILVVIHVLQRG